MLRSFHVVDPQKYLLNEEMIFFPHQSAMCKAEATKVKSQQSWGMRIILIANINYMLTVCQSLGKYVILIYFLEQRVKVGCIPFHIVHMRKP